MTYYDLTAYQRRRLSENPVCQICKRVIYYDEDLIFDKCRVGRKLDYRFYHERCVIKAYGKKEVKELIQELRDKEANFSAFKKVIACGT